MRELPDLDIDHPFYSEKAIKARQERIKELERRERQLTFENKKRYQERNKEKGETDKEAGVMSVIDFHKRGEVLLHIDNKGEIVGVEIPEREFELSRIQRPAFVVNKAENPLCTRGVVGCVEELPVPDVPYILCAHYESETLHLDTVSIDNGSLIRAYKEKRQAMKTYNNICTAFDPISPAHKDSTTCLYCSLLETCRGGGLGYGGFYG